ncbi:biogenesis of lysosome-related organelles complex 1 subunit 6-like isoform X1 [Temnothorax curvispinosus]|uniref:Biogenesis of lysosome-related organelles complex 1 subunit 6 n=1 Tax=Temnothorax curvispinosus TaxID=300111 RepID=A0A6J1QI76_9HYME|nr:biogenesis of lysosome-related organelles complex 1 subunit 6-like [Temnothorax curvispinosus]XP_024884518.1 biogenesis of lysosome-related organelles complex 1 subunit 6-like isoform X1 [Temnothorax curvispinosus]
MMTDVGEAGAAEIQLKPEGQLSEDTVDFSEAVEKLAEGLLSIYQPPLEQVKQELFELTSKQEALLARMQLENKKIHETFEDIDLNDMFSTVKIYQGKLAVVRKEMINIHERTSKLKKRVLRLQQIKQKEAMNREQQREQELRREQELIGRSTSN